ncbi:uncharacterized protein LOC110028114 [Phalaenopsis equestris]|uniref:uncharacterized protein LOC110028114 n=1 Tax=Phalaenopsis equestris TaxID=78828 RepID=UPI0009E37687|nr:uncharacterized protein LOC110028114 [Phalaenopsis equestris]
MSPSPLFLRQNNANLPKNQHISQSSLETQQDFSVKNGKEANLMASLSCSSSSSSNLLGEEQEAVAAMAADDDDKKGGYCTPSSPESRIPAAVHCPPAPKKPKVCRRRVVRRYAEGQKVTFFEGLSLVVFEEISCCRRRRRSRSVRGRLAIAASAAETGK